ncbi:MAG: cytidine deaminase [Saccharofermentanales bacterium]
MEWDILVDEAFEARKNAYTPYSNFAVGAAVLTKNGKIYRGCNIENAAYSPTNCAERTAIFKAVSEGDKDFVAIAVCGGFEDDTDYCFPCGVCRQVLMEFCNPDKFLIIIAKSNSDYKVFKLDELLPNGFGPANLM